MAAVDADFVALSEAVTEAVSLIGAAIAAEESSMTLVRDVAENALAASAAALPALLDAADAAVEALEGA